MSSSRKMWREFLSLLVAVGGVKGTVAVCAAALCGGSAFGIRGLRRGRGRGDGSGRAGAPGIRARDADDGVRRRRHGRRLDRARRGDEREKKDENPSASPTEAYLEPMAKYQQEETLSNPCKSMPPWMDATVALTAESRMRCSNEAWCWDSPRSGWPIER